MFEETRWLRLIDQFRQENYNLYQLSSQSVFTVAFQAGLSALKTPYPFILTNTIYYIGIILNLIKYLINKNGDLTSAVFKNTYLLVK